jgi:Mn2+/Fe2+ NRAMP family transporter
MGVVLTTTAGLSIWIILWATGFKAFDSFLIAIVLILIAATLRTLLPHLPGRAPDPDQ